MLTGTYEIQYKKNKRVLFVEDAFDVMSRPSLIPATNEHIDRLLVSFDNEIINLNNQIDKLNREKEKLNKFKT